MNTEIKIETVTDIELAEETIRDILDIPLSSFVLPNSDEDMPAVFVEVLGLTSEQNTYGDIVKAHHRFWNENILRTYDFKDPYYDLLRRITLLNYNTKLPNKTFETFKKISLGTFCSAVKKLTGCKKHISSEVASMKKYINGVRDSQLIIADVLPTVTGDMPIGKLLHFGTLLLWNYPKISSVDIDSHAPMLLAFAGKQCINAFLLDGLYEVSKALSA